MKDQSLYSYINSGRTRVRHSTLKRWEVAAIDSARRFNYRMEAKRKASGRKLPPNSRRKRKLRNIGA